MPFRKFIRFTNEQISEDYSKRLCFINNIRSKYVVVGLISVALCLNCYDIFILQKKIDYSYFLTHFKSDIILLVFSFAFALFIFFNQVKSHVQIHNYHKIIHGIISLFILCWSAFKTAISLLDGHSNYFILIIAVILISTIYHFKTLAQLSQYALSILFLASSFLLYNIAINDFIKEIAYIAVVFAISFGLSRHLLNLQLAIFNKEAETAIYKKKFQE